MLNTDALISKSPSCKPRNLSACLRILLCDVRPWIRLMRRILIIYRLRDVLVSVTWLSRWQKRMEHSDSEKGLMICKPHTQHTQSANPDYPRRDSNLLIPVRFVYRLETSLWATQKLGQRRFVREHSRSWHQAAHACAPLALPSPSLWRIYIDSLIQTHTHTCT